MTGREDMIIYPGDILFIRNPNLFGRLIAWFTTKKGEEKTWATHIGVFVSNGFLMTKGAAGAKLVEAVNRVKYHNFLDRYTTDNQFAIARPRKLTNEQQYTITNRAIGYVGMTYGYLKIGLHAIDQLLGDIYFFRRLGRLDRYPICSYLVAKCYAAAGLNFGVPPGKATPDDIWDFCMRNPDKYRFLYYSHVM